MPSSPWTDIPMLVVEDDGHDREVVPDHRIDLPEVEAHSPAAGDLHNAALGCYPCPHGEPEANPSAPSSHFARTPPGSDSG
jgi:hypothetical protein